MTDTLLQVPISLKEAEALMWVAGQIGNWPERKPKDDRDPLAVLLAAGYNRSAIMEAVGAIEQIAYNKLISEPLTALERDMLRVCIENTSWIETYRTHEPTAHVPALIEEALAALRSLAKKLDRFGIEITHIPFN